MVSASASADDVARVKQLRKLLEQGNHHYYVLDHPLYTDADYDALFAELKGLEDRHPSLATEDSPTRRVGAVGSGRGFVRRPHLQPMLSLSNAASFADMEAFVARVRRFLLLQDENDELSYCAEPKLDGLAITAIYRNGSLQLALTRGDGEQGEDITANLRMIPSIPAQLVGDLSSPSTPPPLLEVRMEVFMPRSGFIELNKRMDAEGKKSFVNPRNAAASSVRQLVHEVTGTRPLDYYCYGLGQVEGYSPPDSHLQVLQQLKKWGLQINPRNLLCNRLSSLRTHYHKLLQQRDELDYDMDGMVCKLDSLALRERMGQSGHDPRWAIAWKFPPEERATRLLDVEFQIGRTGAVTPVGKLEPVAVGGVTVRNVSLHNFDELQRLDVRIGDTVVVRRAGDVIPKVVAVLAHLRPQPEPPPVPLPSHCPCPLQRPLQRQQEEVIWYCTGGHECPQRQLQGLVHFVSRRGLDISGLSDKLLAQLIEAGWVTDAADLYQLNQHREALIELPRLAQKSVDFLLKSIENSRSVSLAKLIFALGVAGVGEGAALLLARKFDNLPALIDADVEKLEEVSTVGAGTAATIRAWFDDVRNSRLLQRLQMQLEIAKVDAAGPLANRSFLFTGTLSVMGREEASDRLRRMGGEIRTSLSASLDFLVVGEKPGGKLKRAQEIGVRILTEEEFAKLLQDAPAFIAVADAKKQERRDD